MDALESCCGTILSTVPMAEWGADPPAVRSVGRCELGLAQGLLCRIGIADRYLDVDHGVARGVARRN